MTKCINHGGTEATEKTFKNEFLHSFSVLSVPPWLSRYPLSISRMMAVE
jgi:hypothetical protein